MKADDLVLTCPGASAPALATDYALGCPSSWSGNTASYGPSTATTASALSLLTPASGGYASYLSDSQLQVTIAVTDAYGQVISAGSTEAKASFVASGASGVAPTGVTVLSATAGVANFSSLRLRAQPGSYTLLFGG